MTRSKPLEARKLIELMNTAEALKCNTRHSWTSTGRHESVAEHSWRLSLLAYFIKNEFPEADINKVILMCICHDLGEAFTGDIPSFNKTESDEAAETAALKTFLSGLPEPFRSELTELYSEMAGQQTLEARLYKALDKLEAVVQHNSADIATWLPLEYALNFEYGREEADSIEYLRLLRQEICRDTARKIEQQKTCGGKK
jgi:putative hydrolase of HD superfamily